MQKKVERFGIACMGNELTASRLVGAPTTTALPMVGERGGNVVVDISVDSMPHAMESLTVGNV